MNLPGKRQTMSFILAASLFLLALFPPRLSASSLTLAWDPNTEGDLAGYKVYYGVQSRDYDFVIDVGNTTTYRLDGLLDGVTYYITLTAYDTSGNESNFSDEVFGVGTTDPINDPPTADAGPDQTVREGVTVTLDASNSSDPDDGIASYLWEQIAGIAVTLSDPRIANPTFVAPPVDASGMLLSFRVTVRDNGGLQASDEVSVTVNDTSPLSPASVQTGSETPNDPKRPNILWIVAENMSVLPTPKNSIDFNPLVRNSCHLL